MRVVVIVTDWDWNYLGQADVPGVDHAAFTAMEPVTREALINAATRLVAAGHAHVHAAAISVAGDDDGDPIEVTAEMIAEWRARHGGGGVDYTERFEHPDGSRSVVIERRAGIAPPVPPAPRRRLK